MPVQFYTKYTKNGQKHIIFKIDGFNCLMFISAAAPEDDVSTPGAARRSHLLSAGTEAETGTHREHIKQRKALRQEIFYRQFNRDV